jgi:hypothetical protein
MHTIGATPYPCGTNNCADGGDIATLATMDVNGDGLMDIVSGQSEGLPGLPPPPGGLIWWQAPADRRNGTWIKHTIDANVVDTHQIVIADMNKDGNLDIVVSEQDQSPLRRVMVLLRRWQRQSDARGSLQRRGSQHGCGQRNQQSSRRTRYPQLRSRILPQPSSFANLPQPLLEIFREECRYFVRHSAAQAGPVRSVICCLGCNPLAGVHCRILQ